MESATSYICGCGGGVGGERQNHESATSAGLTLRQVGLVGRFAGNWPRAALMAACTSRAARVDVAIEIELHDDVGACRAG